MGKGRATVTNTLRLLQLPTGAQRALAERTISAGHARALLGTPDRALQEKMVEQIVEEGLTVRAVEELVRQGGSELRVVPDAPEAEEQLPASTGTTSGTTEPSTRRPTVRKLPEPGVLELEDRRVPGLDAAAELGVDLTELVDADIEDGHMSAHPRGDARRVVAGGTATDDHHVRGGHPWYAAHQDASAAVAAHQVIRPDLGRQPSGDLTHRGQERKRD